MNHLSTTGQPQSASPFGDSSPQQTSANPFQLPSFAPVQRSSAAFNQQAHRRKSAQPGLVQQQPIVHDVQGGANTNDLAAILSKIIHALQLSSTSNSPSSASINMWRILLAQLPNGSTATEQPSFFAPPPSALFTNSVVKPANGKQLAIILPWL